MRRLSDNEGPQQGAGTNGNIVHTAVLMSLLTFGAKGIGFVRELLLAGYFGTSYVTNAYVMATSIPNILLGGVLSVLGMAFMPVYSEIVEHTSVESGNQFTNRIITFALLIASLVAVVGISLSDKLVALLAPSFDKQTAELTSDYLKIVFLYNIFLAISGIVESYLRYNGKFLLPILATYLNNFALLLFIIISAYTSYYYLAYGLLVGMILQLFADMNGVKRLGYHCQIDWQFGESVRNVFSLAFPAFISSSLGNINAMIDKMIAASLPEGSVAALNYGLALESIPNLLVISIILTIFFPKAIESVNRGDWQHYGEIVKMSMAVIIVFALPFSIGSFVFSDEAVQVIFERGAFDNISTAVTAGSFRFYSIGLVFAASAGLLTRMFYSLKEMKIPVVCGAISILCNVILDLTLSRPMRHEGLALASSVAAVVNFGLLSLAWNRRHEEIRIFPPKKKLVQISVASISAVAVAVVTYRLVSLIWMPRMAYLALAVVMAIATYLILLKILKVDEVAIVEELFNRQRRNHKSTKRGDDL